MFRYSELGQAFVLLLVVLLVELLVMLLVMLPAVLLVMLVVLLVMLLAVLVVLVSAVWMLAAWRMRLMGRRRRRRRRRSGFRRGRSIIFVARDKFVSPEIDVDGILSLLNLEVKTLALAHVDHALLLIVIIIIVVIPTVIIAGFVRVLRIILWIILGIGFGDVGVNEDGGELDILGANNHVGRNVALAKVYADVLERGNDGLWTVPWNQVVRAIASTNHVIDIVEDIGQLT
jgi:hypothetical protein